MLIAKTKQERNRMSSWKKTNKTICRVHYSMDKYRETEDGSSVKTLEGEMVYVNMPFASTFVNIEDSDGKMTSISRDCILKVDWLKLPKWALLKEAQVVDSAEMRLKNLDRELTEEKKRFNSQENLDKMLDEHDEASKSSLESV